MCLIGRMGAPFVLDDVKLNSEVEFETPQCCYLKFSTCLSLIWLIRVVFKWVLVLIR